MGGRISVAALILHGLQQHKCNTVPSVRGLIGSHWPGLKVSAELHLHSFLEALEDFIVLRFSSFRRLLPSLACGHLPPSSKPAASRPSDAPGVLCLDLARSYVSTFKDLGDSIEPPQITQGNLPITRLLTLIPSAVPFAV